MSKYSVSNIALPAFDHTAELSRLTDLGFDGIEVAPSRVWRDTWKGLTSAQVTSYAKAIKGAGLATVGLHSLFFDHPELGLFRDPETRSQTLDFLEHLSKLCRDLGGRTLVYGGGRHRRDMPEAVAYTEAIDFAGELCCRVEAHGTCFCFEPLGPTETDFIHSAFDALKIVKAVNHPALQIQLDAKALVANSEASLETFLGVKEQLVHYHANEPGFAILGSTQEVDHERLGGFLRDANYAGYVSIEQRMFSEEDPLADVATSANVLRNFY